MRVFGKAHSEKAYCIWIRRKRKMSMATIGAILTLIVFVAVLATPKLPNWFCFLIMAPIVVFTGTMDADGVYAVLSSSSFHLIFRNNLCKKT